MGADIFLQLHVQILKLLHPLMHVGLGYDFFPNQHIKEHEKENDYREDKQYFSHAQHQNIPP